MSLRDKTNDELFRVYTDDLILRVYNEKNLRDTRKLLERFSEHLGIDKSSREAAKSFLVQYAHRKPRTRYSYTEKIKACMIWYREPLDDVKVKVPRSLPPYTEDADIEKLLEAAGRKRSHKGSIERDRLLIKLAWRAGMRRGEIASPKYLL